MVFHWTNKLVPADLSPIYINNASINRVYSVTFLGVVLDVSLKFEDHVLKVTKKISIFIQFIYRIWKYLNKALLMQLYFGLIYSNLFYCITVWVVSNENVINLLKISQNKLVKFVAQIKWIAPDHYFINWKYFMLKKCITIWLVIIYKNRFQRFIIPLYAMKVNTILDKF